MLFRSILQIEFSHTTALIILVYFILLWNLWNFVTEKLSLLSSKSFSEREILSFCFIVRFLYGARSSVVWASSPALVSSGWFCVLALTFSLVVDRLLPLSYFLSSMVMDFSLVLTSVFHRDLPGCVWSTVLVVTPSNRLSFLHPPVVFFPFLRWDCFIFELFFIIKDVRSSCRIEEGSVDVDCVIFDS